jgi:hypothetical protein
MDLKQWITYDEQIKARVVRLAGLERPWERKQTITCKEDFRLSSELLSIPALFTHLIDLSSVWRPLEHVVEDYPLAVCDGSSIDKSSLVCFDNVTQIRIGESMQAVYADGLRWYYLSNQTKDEVMLLKIYDSSPTVKVKCTSSSIYPQHLYQPLTF